MKPLFIHSASSISAQNTFQNNSKFETLERSLNKAVAQHPDYKKYIDPAAARRMSPTVKMGVTAAKEAMQMAGVDQPAAIIVGTGMGCMADTEKFLNALIENDEQFLAPTAFIQSTHNTVGAQIALLLGCKAYNTTYVHGSLSFESALQDAQLLLAEGQGTVLLGGVDELGTEFVDYMVMMEKKKEKPQQIPYSEGATFFVVSTEKKVARVQISDFETHQTLSEASIEDTIVRFLELNDLTPADIDVLLTGNDGTKSDTFYNFLLNGIFQHVDSIHFKEWAGSYDTVSAFGTWMGYKLLNNPDVFDVVNRIDSKTYYKNALIYNQSNGENHSFMLLSRC